jgi:two-component system sensor histidine kinase KdpD
VFASNARKDEVVRSLRSRDPHLATGLALGLGLVVALSALLVPFRDDVTRVPPALVLVIAVVVAALVGGRVASVVTAAAAALAFNLAFIRPYWTLNIAIIDDVVAFAVFTAVGVSFGTLVAIQAERRRVAEQRARELQVLNQRLEVVQAERERLAEETTRLAVLEQVDVQRAALLRSVSHDLRTPLSVIQAVTSDLRAGTGYDDSTRDELLDLVLDEAQRLDRIVANLLSLSRIETGSLRPERQAVVLGELASTCASRLARLFRRTSIKLDIADDLPLADADYTQLDQVLMNLLENAARHAPADTTILVGAHQQDGMVEVFVEDEGPGVPEQLRQRIFEPFWQGEDSSSSGIGLAICRALVEAHGGSIHVEAPDSGGARFVFTVPARHD